MSVNLLNSTNVGEVTRQVTTSIALYKHSFPDKKRQVFPFTQFPEIWNSRFWREKLTSSSEGFWPVNFRLLWFFVFLFQALQIIETRIIQPTDLLSIIIFHTLKPYYLNKHIINLFYSTQQDFLSFLFLFLFFFFSFSLARLEIRYQF